MGGELQLFEALDAELRMDLERQARSDSGHRGQESLGVDLTSQLFEKT